MEIPSIITEFEPQIMIQIAYEQEHGNDVDYYAYFIQFLEEKQQEAMVNGDIRVYRTRRPGLKRANQAIPFISFGVSQIEYAIKFLKKKQQQESGKTPVETGTARQSALAFYYMQKASAFPRKTGSNSKDAEFIRFLTGHNLDTIRKILGNPLKRTTEKTGKATQELLKDLTIVLNQFELIQFSKGVELVENDIKTLQNDLNSFNPM